MAPVPNPLAHFHGSLVKYHVMPSMLLLIFQTEREALAVHVVQALW